MENTTSQDSTRTKDPYARPPRKHHGELVSLDPSPWKDNQGNLLVGLTALICLIGCGLLAYQQTRFSPPRFPTRFDTTPSADGKDHLAENNMLPSQVADVAALSADRTITVQIIGAATDNGVMKIAIYSRPDGFNDSTKALDTDNWKITGGLCEGKLQIPRVIEWIAIAAFHDENGNGTLDKNALGIPTERYGYSGGTRGLTGPPAFSEAVVELGNSPINISIR